MDDTESLEAVAIDDSTASIVVCGGQDIFVYRPYGNVKDETLKVRSSAIWPGGGEEYDGIIYILTVYG